MGLGRWSGAADRGGAERGCGGAAAAARRARRPAAGGAGGGVEILRAAGAGDRLPGLGYGALRPHRPECADPGNPHRRPGAAGGGRAHQPDRGADHRQRHPAAPAAARVHPQVAEDHRRRPAHGHEPAAAAAEPGRLPAHRHRHGGRRVRGARRHRRRVSARPHHARAPRLLRRHAGADEGVRPRNAAHLAHRAEADPDADQRGGLRARRREALPPRLRRDVRRGQRRGSAVRGDQRRPALSRAGALAAAVPRASGDAVRLHAGCSRQFRPAGRRGGGRAVRADPRALRRARQRPGDADLRRSALQAGAGGEHVPRGRRVGEVARRAHGAAYDGLRAGARCLARSGALVPGQGRAKLRGRTRRARPQRVRCHGRVRAQS